MLWILEMGIFGEGHPLARGIIESGHNVLPWSEDMRVPKGLLGPVVFHGSLNVASDLARQGRYTPGPILNEVAFRCQEYYPRLMDFVLNRRYAMVQVESVLADPGSVGELLGTSEVFIRPDGPMKEFAGRTLSLDSFDPNDLGLGLYYDDPKTWALVAPRKEILREWRVIIAGRRPVAASAYDPIRRATIPSPPGDVWRVKSFAYEIAGIYDPDVAYMMDVCETPSGLRLLELNPFSGADPYGCDPHDTVYAVVNAIMNRR